MFVGNRADCDKALHKHSPGSGGKFSNTLQRAFTGSERWFNYSGTATQAGLWNRETEHQGVSWDDLGTALCPNTTKRNSRDSPSYLILSSVGIWGGTNWSRAGIFAVEGIGTENMKVSYGLRIVVHLRSKNESRYPRTLYHYKKPCVPGSGRLDTNH